MAGTIVADTIQDGAGNSTSMDNAIYGSAKSWATFTPSGSGSSTILASYNVSSITTVTGGVYQVNFTNNLTDGNYSILGTCSTVGNSQGTVIATVRYPSQGNGATPTSSSYRISATNQGGSFVTPDAMWVAVFR